MPDPAVGPPQIDPERWFDHDGFRELFLYRYTRPADNACLRRLGSLLAELYQGSHIVMPRLPEDRSRTMLRAFLGDLRFLQGFARHLGTEYLHKTSDPWEQGAVCLAARLESGIAAMAQEIEQELQK